MIEIPEEYIDKCGDMFDAVVNLFSTEFTPDSIDKAFDQTFLDVKTKYNISDEDFYLLITAIILKLASSCDITCSQVLDDIASYIGIDSNSEEIVQSVHKEMEKNMRKKQFKVVDNSETLSNESSKKDPHRYDYLLEDLRKLNALHTQDNIEEKVPLYKRWILEGLSCEYDREVKIDTTQQYQEMTEYLHERYKDNKYFEIVKCGWNHLGYPAIYYIRSYDYYYQRTMDKCPSKPYLTVGSFKLTKVNGEYMTEIY